jgi:hypothetical protein
MLIVLKTKQTAAASNRPLPLKVPRESDPLPNLFFLGQNRSIQSKKNQQIYLLTVSTNHSNV